jgi:hypothetical protein
MSVAALTQIKATDIAVRNKGRVPPLLECRILKRLQLPVSSVIHRQFARCSHDNRVQCGRFMPVRGDANLKAASELDFPQFRQPYIESRRVDLASRW